MYLPIGLFGVSIATAVLPEVARLAVAGDRRSIRHTVSHGLSLMLIVNVPAMFGLWVLATPIVRLLLEHGRFEAADTAATAAALRLYAIGLVGYSAVRIVSPVFYALGRNRVPVIVSAVSILVNIVLSIWFVKVLGYRGLALSTSIAAVLNAGALLWLLRAHLDRIEGRRLARTTGGIVAAAVVMALVALVVQRGLAGLLGDHSIASQAVALTSAILAGLGTLALVTKALGVEEFDEAFAALIHRARSGADQSGSTRRDTID
jgi:putative peptidoglycan lipid II flippase